MPVSPDIPPSSALPAGLAGLCPRGLMAEALRPPVTSPAAAERWTPPAVEELAPLFPDYHLERLAGRGGMGAVYEGRHTGLNRRVAVKVLPVEMSDDPAFAARFQHEARAMASLRHPAIVAVYDSGQTTDGHLFYAMEYVEGEDLATRLRRGRPALAESLALIGEICEALAAAHDRGVIHRDIKPANILLTKDGHAKLADFGLALSLECALETARLTHAGSTVGTLEYAAPEQLNGIVASGPAADIYSLGVLTYELLTGEVPRGVFDPPSVRNAEVDPAFDGVVLRALQSDPARRYPTASAFRDALERPQKTERRVRRLTRLAAVISVLGLIAAGSGLLAWRESREARTQEAEATLARKDAEGLVNFMLTDLRDKLERVGRLDALEGVVAKAEGWFASVPAGARGDDFEERRAEFFRTKGVVMRVQRKFPQALAALGYALEVRQRLAAAHPGDPHWQLAVARAHQDLGEVGMLQSRYDEALTQYTRARAVADAAAKFAPGDVEIANRTALATIDVARAIGYLRRFPESTATYEDAQRQFDKLAAAHPQDQRFRRQIRWIEADIGSNCEAEEHFEEALAHFQRLKNLTAEVATDPVHDDDLAGAAVRVATVLLKLSRADEALRELVNSLPLAEQRAAEHPGNRERLQSLEWNYKIAAQALAKLGRTTEAAAMKEKHQRVSGQIHSPPGTLPDPADGEAADEDQRAKSEALFAMAAADGAGEATHAAWRHASEQFGKELIDQNHRDQALDHFNSWKVRLVEKCAAFPPGSLWHRDLAHTFNRIGALHESASAWPEALAAYRESLTIRQAMLASSASGEATIPRQYVISSLEHLDDVFKAQGETARRIENATAMLDILATPEDRAGIAPAWFTITARIAAGTAEAALAEPALAASARTLAQSALDRLPGVPEQEKIRLRSAAGK